MAKDTGEQAPAYANPDQTTGYWDDNSKVTMFDPNTGEYITKTVDPDNIFEYNPKNDQTSWGMVDGERTLIYTGGGGYLEGGMEYAGDNNWDWVYGAPPLVGDGPPPISNGMDRETGGQNFPKPGDPAYDNWTPPEPIDKWAPDPTSPPGYDFDPDRTTGGGRTDDPFTPTGGGSTPINWGGGGSTGVEPSTGVDWGSIGADNPLIGWEGSTNKDFYQQQFKDMRDRTDNEGLRAFAAAIRADEARNAPAPEATDPWGWAGGSEQFAPVVGGAPEGVDPNSWTLNPQYGWEQGTTNAQILGDLGAIFNTDEQAMLNKHQQNPNNNWDESIYWSSAPRDQVYDSMFGGANKQDPNWTNVLQKIYNNVWTQPGTAPTPGGMNVPAGYASPTNA